VVVGPKEIKGGSSVLGEDVRHNANAIQVRDHPSDRHQHAISLAEVRHVGDGPADQEMGYGMHGAVCSFLMQLARSDSGSATITMKYLFTASLLMAIPSLPGFL